jgi:hypothetical protein
MYCDEVTPRLINGFIFQCIELKLPSSCKYVIIALLCIRAQSRIICVHNLFVLQLP